MTSRDRQTVEALTKAVTASDAGRRVGWARAYAAESSKENLSHDVNILRMERDIMRRAASFLYGFFIRYLEIRGDGSAAREALSRWSEQVGAVLDPDIGRAGREAAESLIVVDEERAAAKAAEKAERKRVGNQLERAWKEGRARERELLAKRYGFANVAAMMNFLETNGQKR